MATGERRARRTPTIATNRHHYWRQQASRLAFLTQSQTAPSAL